MKKLIVVAISTFMLLGSVLGIAAESGGKAQKTGFGVLQQEEVSIGDPLEVKVQFVDEANGEVIGEQELVLIKGNNSYNDLQKHVELLSGYELCQSGDFWFDEKSERPLKVEVRKVVTSKQINVTFIDAQGNNVGGGDATVDADGDGIANYSELEVPEGYELADLGYEQTTDIEIHYGSTGAITLVVEKVKEVTPSTPSEKPGKVNISCAGLADKNCDGVVTCDEAMGEDWTWNNAKGVCEYTGSYTVVNTGVK